MIKIYGFCNTTDLTSNWLEAVAIADTGLVVGSHICSNISFCKFDLARKADKYDELLGKDNWELEFISPSDVANHEGLKNALELNRQMGEKENDKQNA